MSDKKSAEVLEKISSGIEGFDDLTAGGLPRRRATLVTSGAFDLTGLLAALEAKAREMGAKLIAFDAIDVLLSLLDDPAAECRELYRLHEWLTRNEFTGGGLAARAVAERLIYLCRNADITALFTSMPEGIDPHLETTTLHVSTISDSWIQISYSLLDGERNRALSIIKSRGSKHSNQVRELVFSDTGITLADPYTAGGQVLMGTLRMEKENAMHTETTRKRHEIDQKRREVEQFMTERDQHLAAAQRDLRNRSEELDTLTLAAKTSTDESTHRHDDVVRKRDGALLEEQAAWSTPASGKPASADVKSKVKRA